MKIGVSSTSVTVTVVSMTLLACPGALSVATTVTRRLWCWRHDLGVVKVVSFVQR